MRHAPWIARLARAGYAAKGTIYLVIGLLALRAAFGTGGGTTDSQGALATIGQSGAGRLLVLAMGVGLAGYAVWALLAAWLDAEDRGDDAKGVAIRIGQGARGLAYGLLGVRASMLAAGNGGGNGDGAERWSAEALQMPGGRVVLGLVAAGFLAYAGYQFWRGLRKNLQKRLRLGGADPGVMRWVLRIARFGIVARGLVFLVIAWLFFRATREGDAGEAGGIGDSLATLQDAAYGGPLLALVAAGLMGYGVWQLCNARYREIPVS